MFPLVLLGKSTTQRLILPFQKIGYSHSLSPYPITLVTFRLNQGTETRVRFANLKALTFPELSLFMLV